INVQKEKGTNYILELTKITLFDELVNKQLKIEKIKSGFSENQQSIFIRRVQQTLALIMEINQSNIITEEEFWTIVDDINSTIFNLSSIELIKDFWERTLIKKNANNEIEFQNTEIQEYLAAKEIVRLGNINQLVFDIAFEPELKEVLPSWYNTLSFLVDLSPYVFKSLLSVTSNSNHQVVHS